MCHTVRADPIPRVVREIGVARVISIAEPCRGPPPARVLPFCFRRQSVNAAYRYPPRRPFPLREGCTVVRRFTPAHSVHRVAGALEGAGIASRQSLILSLGHRVTPHPKPPTDRHCRLRPLVHIPIHFGSRAAHAEGPRWNE